MWGGGAVWGWVRCTIHHEGSEGQGRWTEVIFSSQLPNSHKSKSTNSSPCQYDLSILLKILNGWLTLGTSTIQSIECDTNTNTTLYLYIILYYIHVFVRKIDISFLPKAES